VKSIFLSIFLALYAVPAASGIQEISLQQLQENVLKKDNVVYVVNFWATWCKPCVGELPYFENADKKFPKEKVKVILISLDFPKEKERIKSFIAKHNITSTVYHLSETNPNSWINKVDSSWSGAIPATAFYKNGKKTLFHEGELNQQELDSIIQQQINIP
jgi:thiol-disulfide isomerase/thioredoxin